MGDQSHYELGYNIERIKYLPQLQEMKDEMDSRLGHARARIARLPRISLALKPTPLHELPRLAKQLGGPKIFIKRDDLTGLALGGNKTRNLEFRLAHALPHKPDVMIAGLDLQSNSARQTTAACSKIGAKTILVLEGRPPEEIQGNLLVDYLLGADVRFARDRNEQRQMMDEAAAEAKKKGFIPYILNDSPMFEMGSALAYLDCAIECIEQLAALNTKVKAIYMSSSGKGQAGLALARRLFGNPFEVRCVAARGEFDVSRRAAEIANRTATLLGYEESVLPEDIVNFGEFIGPGYGIPTQAGNEAVRLFARTEGIILDPIYTGKCAAGMIEHIRRRDFEPDDAVLFVHTGGIPALFTHNHLWV
jgi:D-cysteine desulfhydrase/L-cysteate sulfo-lyase